MRLDQEELLRLAGAGDRDAFHQLYLETERTVYGFILSILKNRHDAEEVLQETYLKIWISAQNYQPQGKPLAWMLTIARNLCYMKFRDRKYLADMGLDELMGEESGEWCSALEQIPDAMVLKTALETLGEEERQIVLLHASSGLKHREIAENLGMPLATVLSKYNRAMKKLKQYMENGKM